MSVADLFFVAFPYLAIVVAIIGGIYRYINDRFSYSTQSSQMLEDRWQFWASVSWHYPIVLILLAHLAAFVIPWAWSWLHSLPEILWLFDVIGLAMALTALVASGLLIVRRIVHPQLWPSTTAADWLLLFSLFAQVLLGFWTAFVYRWGAAWYVDTATPWLRSIFMFQPQIQHVTPLPVVVQLHFVFGFFVIALFPFTRLAHVVVFPITYLARRFQVVLWNR